MSVIVNRWRLSEEEHHPKSAKADALKFHKKLPGYKKTQLFCFEDELAKTLGVQRVLIKVENDRFGLPAFKMLGASYGTYRELCRLQGGEEPEWESLEDLKKVFSSFPIRKLSAATDGNHGRAVARMAALLGFECVIYVPQDMVQERISAIESEGAEVVIVKGSYDEAVRASAKEALVISDTSWEGYEQVPRDIVDGYSTIFMEIDEDGYFNPDYVFVPTGVGALCCAAVEHYPRSKVISVEPAKANCVQKSIENGKLTDIDLQENCSCMCGLNCGIPSSVAFPSLMKGLSYCVSIEDAQVEDAIRMLYKQNINSGETGAAALAGAFAFKDFKEFEKDSTILILVTEGVTDQANFDKIINKI